MIRLHQSTRRRICQAGFVLFCLLPTAAIFGWSASLKSSQHLRSCESLLTEQLGLKAKLAAVSYPQPNVTLLHGLELNDPETDQPVFSCRLLEATAIEGRLVLDFKEPLVEAERLYQLWELLGRRLRGELMTREPIELSWCNLTIRDGRGEQTYELVGARIEREEAGEAAEVRFKLPGVEMPEPASVRIVRNRQRQPPSTRFALSTGGAALPCSLFAALCDVEGAFGAAATFSGSLWVDDTDQGWEAEVAGRFEKIDLGQLVSSRFHHRLEGEATLELTEARIRESQLIEAHGRLTAGPGEISVSLVQAAVAELACSNERDVRSLDARARGPYERLAFNFGLDGAGLRLAGNCEDQPPGTVLIGGAYSSLSLRSADRALPVVALLRLLAPASDEQAPATSVTQELIPWLPMPPVIRPTKPGGASATPVAHPRLKTGS
jgi:hypothetical protein